MMDKLALCVFAFLSPFPFLADGFLGDDAISRLLTSTPLGGALVCVVWMFLRYMEKRDAQAHDDRVVMTDAVKELTSYIKGLER